MLLYNDTDRIGAMRCPFCNEYPEISTQTIENKKNYMIQCRNANKKYIERQTLLSMERNHSDVYIRITLILQTRQTTYTMVY